MGGVIVECVSSGSEPTFDQSAANGRKEPKVTGAVACSNVKFGKYLDINRQRARDFHLP